MTSPQPAQVRSLRALPAASWQARCHGFPSFACTPSLLPSKLREMTSRQPLQRPSLSSKQASCHGHPSGATTNVAPPSRGRQQPWQTRAVAPCRVRTTGNRYSTSSSEARPDSTFAVSSAAAPFAAERRPRGAAFSRGAHSRSAASAPALSACVGNSRLSITLRSSGASPKRRQAAAADRRPPP